MHEITAKVALVEGNVSTHYGKAITSKTGVKHLRFPLLQRENLQRISRNGRRAVIFILSQP